MRISDSDRRVDAAGSGRELAGADQLISDLAALLDAGLVVVHEHVLGPARYGVAPVADHRAQRPHRVGVVPVADHRTQRPHRVGVVPVADLPDERPHHARPRQPAVIGGAVLE